MITAYLGARPNVAQLVENIVLRRRALRSTAVTVLPQAAWSAPHAAAGLVVLAFVACSVCACCCRMLALPRGASRRARAWLRTTRICLSIACVVVSIAVPRLAPSIACLLWADVGLKLATAAVSMALKPRALPAGPPPQLEGARAGQEGDEWRCVPHGRWSLTALLLMSLTAAAVMALWTWSRASPRASAAPQPTPAAAAPATTSPLSTSGPPSSWILSASFEGLAPVWGTYEATLGLGPHQTWRICSLGMGGIAVKPAPVDAGYDAHQQLHVIRCGANCRSAADFVNHWYAINGTQGLMDAAEVVCYASAPFAPPTSIPTCFDTVNFLSVKSIPINVSKFASMLDSFPVESEARAAGTYNLIKALFKSGKLGAAYNASVQYDGELVAMSAHGSGCSEPPCLNIFDYRILNGIEQARILRAAYKVGVAIHGQSQGRLLEAAACKLRSVLLWLLSTYPSAESHMEIKLTALSQLGWVSLQMAVAEQDPAKRSWLYTMAFRAWHMVHRQDYRISGAPNTWPSSDGWHAEAGMAIAARSLGVNVTWAGAVWSNYLRVAAARKAGGRPLEREGAVELATHLWMAASAHEPGPSESRVAAIGTDVIQAAVQNTAPYCRQPSLGRL